VPAFEALLDAQGGDLAKFFTAVKAIAQQPKPERDAALAALRLRAPVAAAER
jgi:predicted aminopeptidase